MSNGFGTASVPTYYQVPGQCPVCGGELHVTRLECGHCHSGLDGHFALGRYARLSPDQHDFLTVFLKNRGVIKDVEAELGISYPTVRGRLDDVIRTLGLAPAADDQLRPSQVREERRNILEQLRAKDITSEEAAVRLASLGGKAD